MILVPVAALLILGYFALSLFQEDVVRDDISPQEQEFNDSGRAKAIEDETDLWTLYYDNNYTGLSIKYPYEIGFGWGADMPINLIVEISPIESLEGTMGYNEETALENRTALLDGDYGRDVDFPVDESKRVVQVGDLYAQDFVVLSRFEVCSVMFERKLYFFKDNHQVVLTLTGPREEIMDSITGYLIEHPDNCMGDERWTEVGQGLFVEDLVRGAGSDVAQDWYDLFDRIVGTIEFHDSPDTGLLQGRWVAVDDPNSVIEIKDGKKIDYYSGEMMSEGVIDITGNSMIVTGEGEAYEYSILELSENKLVLSYLARGNTLEYARE